MKNSHLKFWQYYLITQFLLVCGLAVLISRWSVQDFAYAIGLFIMVSTTIALALCLIALLVLYGFCPATRELTHDGWSVGLVCWLLILFCSSSQSFINGSQAFLGLILYIVAVGVVDLIALNKT